MLRNPHIDLHLFHVGPGSIEIAVSGGVDAIVVDCEQAGKRRRQEGFDTEINRWRPEECARVREAAPAQRVVCRLNCFRDVGMSVLDEARTAADAGAQEVIIPMVERIEEIGWVLDAVRGRAEVGVMIETEWALANAAAIDRLPVRRAFIGLNDLRIARGSSSLFDPLLDGTLDRVRSQMPRVAFGFGGMTLPELGHPVPARLMIGEIARLDCQYTFLRRSFYRDLAATGLEPAEMIARLRAAWTAARRRSDDAIADDHAELSGLLQSLTDRH